MTGASWLCYYRALQEGPVSVTVPIDKLSMLVTIVPSVIVFHERLHVRSALGVMLITAGTLLLVFL
ncbi:MAG: EamA family transporter [Eubacteriales bacterium]|nr:EamA family transporter [Eubacteriales bacterium]